MSAIDLWILPIKSTFNIHKSVVMAVYIYVTIECFIWYVMSIQWYTLCVCVCVCVCLLQFVLFFAIKFVLVVNLSFLIRSQILNCAV